MAKKEYETMTVEELMGRLEEVVGLMESGDLPIEESLKLFKEGMDLSNECNMRLSKIDQEIKTIAEKDGDLIEKPYDLKQ